MNALQIAATGMTAQQTRVDVIAHNLSNMSTTGYNARRAEFADLHYQQVARPGTITAESGEMLPTGIQLGYGVRPTAVSPVLAQGALTETRGDLDIAIEGRGLLEVTLPSGQSAYTRDGGLKRSADGEIVTSDGHVVAPGITIPLYSWGSNDNVGFHAGVMKQHGSLVYGLEYEYINQDIQFIGEGIGPYGIYVTNSHAGFGRLGLAADRFQFYGLLGTTWAETNNGLDDFTFSFGAGLDVAVHDNVILGMRWNRSEFSGFDNTQIEGDMEQVSARVSLKF